MAKKDDNYQTFIKTNTSAYQGEWVAIAKKQVIAHGHDAQKVYEEGVRKSGGARVSLAKAPDQQMLVLTLSL